MHSILYFVVFMSIKIFARSLEFEHGRFTTDQEYQERILENYLSYRTRFENDLYQAANAIQKSTNQLSTLKFINGATWVGSGTLSVLGAGLCFTPAAPMGLAMTVGGVSLGLYAGLGDYVASNFEEQNLEEAVQRLHETYPELVREKFIFG